VEGPAAVGGATGWQGGGGTTSVTGDERAMGGSRGGGAVRKVEEEELSGDLRKKMELSGAHAREEEGRA
jgi:hypothetical protein